MATESDRAHILFDSGRMFYGRLPRAIVMGAGILLIGIFLAMILTGALQSEPVAGVSLGVAVVVVIFLAFGFSRIHVYDNEVRLAWFPFYRRRIPITAVHSAASATIGLRYGFGLRFGGFGLGIIQDTGPAVRLDSGRGYLLSLGTAERQERFLAALAAAGVDVHRP